jgi:hypothetical protein
MHDPLPSDIAMQHLDITGADFVQVIWDENRGVLWVNTNDMCVLRICRIKQLSIGDVMVKDA